MLNTYIPAYLITNPAEFFGLMSNEEGLLSVFRNVAFWLFVIIYILTLFSMLIPTENNLKTPPTTLLVKIIPSGFLIYGSWSACGLLMKLVGYITDTLSGNTTLSAKDILGYIRDSEMPFLLSLVMTLYMIYHVALLALEILERWLFISVLYCMSPLTGAALISPGGEKIVGKFYGNFIMQNVVMFFNLWVIKIVQWMLNNVANAEVSSRWTSVLYMMTVIAVLKLGEKLDTYFNKSGISMASIGPGFFGAVITAALRYMHTAKRVGSFFMHHMPKKESDEDKDSKSDGSIDEGSDDDRSETNPDRESEQSEQRNSRNESPSSESEGFAGYGSERSANSYEQAENTNDKKEQNEDKENDEEVEENNKESSNEDEKKDDNPKDDTDTSSGDAESSSDSTENNSNEPHANTNNTTAETDTGYDPVSDGKSSDKEDNTKDNSSKNNTDSNDSTGTSNNLADPNTNNQSKFTNNDQTEKDIPEIDSTKEDT